VRAAEISEPLQIEVFEAFGDTLYREAIYTVLDNIDHNVEAVREAARAALGEYVTRDPPRPPPKRRLTLPGGKLTKIREQLYLSHKEIADVELRKRLEAIEGKPPAESATLQDMTGRYLAHFDARRQKRLEVALEAGREAFAAGDTATAVQKFDEVLALAAEHAARSEMVKAYLAHGKKMLEAKKNQEAVVALTKAHVLDPDGPSAKEARSRALIARARLIEAEGGDAAAELAKAKAIDPSAGESEGPRWMLFLGIGGGIAGLCLLLAGALVRRRR
jgi:tetratricopeptide (TPR) repeat protein